MNRHKHKFAPIDSAWNVYWSKKYPGNVILACVCGAVKFGKIRIIEMEEAKKK